MTRARKTPCPHGLKLKHSCKTCQNEFYRTYRASNQEKLKAYDKEYRVKYYRENRSYQIVSMVNIRAKKEGAEGVITVEFYDSIINNPCAYCGQSGLPMELDHRVPISKGGSNHPENVHAVCRYCNKAKHWYGEIDFLMWLEGVKQSA